MEVYRAEQDNQESTWAQRKRGGVGRLRHATDLSAGKCHVKWHLVAIPEQPVNHRPVKTLFNFFEKLLFKFIFKFPR